MKEEPYGRPSRIRRMQQDMGRHLFLSSSAPGKGYSENFI